MAEREYERDEGGRFGAGGGGGAAPKEHHPREHHGPKPAAAAPGGEPKAPKRTWTDKAPPEMHGAKETWQTHFTGHPDKGGQPTPERAAMHEQILERAVADKPTFPLDRENPKRVAILTMGGTGVGKSSSLRGLGDTSHFVTIDPDGIKGEMPEWKALTHPDRTYKKAANATHEESSYVAKKLRARAVEAGHNVLVDGTGANPEKMIKLIRELKENGYAVHVAMTHTDAEVAHPRAVKRGNETGRMVEKGTYKRLHAAVPASFMAVKEHADSFGVFDNNRAPAAGGGRQVWGKKRGEAEVHSEPGWTKQFAAQAARPGHRVRLGHLSGEGVRRHGMPTS